MSPIVKFFYAGLLAASTLTSAAFASPIDNSGVAIGARDVIFLGEGDDTSVSVDINNSNVAVRSADNVHASLEKRAFTSPHVRRAVRIVSGGIDASWAFNLWVEEDNTGKSTVWYSGVTGVGITSPKIAVVGPTINSKSATELVLKVPFVLDGYYDRKRFIVHFVVRLVGDIIQTTPTEFYDRPTAIFAGQKAYVNTYSFLTTN